MDLMQQVQKYSRCRITILGMNQAEIAKAYGISLSDARKVQNYAALLEAAE